ncbi:endonuclease MutS2 [Silvanigrella aquatica]|uniref:Endonuclease MutS2 n=1 Tax=Silvanigrella aquatica TaxID=1915309 RepID=A0A1L4CZS0_9BACT|nr:Smr/MutS family protein [Silvanigrella aquatica]APJ03452.1 hypothetical protein AXG55_05850 [Silvanigrella aquatica]
MEHQNNVDNTSSTFLRQDALTRLEWNKITQYLAGFATFPHSKKTFSELEPWLELEDRNFFFTATSEMLDLNTETNGISLESFDFTLFQNFLQRGALLSPQALYQILITLKLCHSIQSFFKYEKSRATKYPNLFNLSNDLKPHMELHAKLNKSVDMDGNILSSASPELHSARSRLEHAKRKIVEQLDEILKKQDIRNALQDDVWMLRDGHYVLPIRADRKSGIEGIPRGVSQSGSTVFIEPQALAMQQAQLEKAQNDVEVEEQRILRELSKDCYLVHEDILSSSEILTQFDNIIARTKFAGVIHGIKPEFLKPRDLNPRFSLINAKHPLFLLENKKCIANDLHLAPKSQGETSPYVWVLSGPNAGGKTVAMKTVGIIALMAKAGLFVSCDKAEIQDYENIFVELGDRQNREEDLSTFSGHLAQIKRISEQANELSLILLDEGFVGTDPAIGVAMARSTLEYFSVKKATVIITTHFSNLKTLADNDSRFFNGSMEFEPHKLLPTYKLLNGIPGQSYAIELAERMGLNNNIIQKARTYYGSESERMENLLKELQLKRIEINEELTKQNLLTQKLDSEFKSLKNEKEQLSELRGDLVENYRNKLQKRLNAFENRLEIRERQFEKQKETLLREIHEISHKETIENNLEISQAQQNNLSEKNQNKLAPAQKKEIINTAKPQKLSGFEALSGIKLPKTTSAKSSPNYQSLDEKAERFRAPKNMSSRSLLDEARMSLQSLKNSFDDIEEQLHDDLDTLQEIEKSTKEKVRSAQQTAKEAQSQGRSPEFWKPGMSAKSTKLKEKGVVLKTADSKGNIECQFGILKIKIPYHELIPGNETLPKQNSSSPQKSSLNVKPLTKNFKKYHNLQDSEIPPTLQHGGNTIQLLGCTVDESLDKLDIELDKMHRMDVDRVVIIHGHGMGKIKESVRRHLEDSSYKLRFRGGRHGEGGDGVTIVEFDE